MSVVLRKLTVEESTSTTFGNEVKSESKEQVAELTEAFGQLFIGDVVSVSLQDTGITMRSMKGRVKTAAKNAGLAVTFAKGHEEFPDQLVFRLRKTQTRKPKVTTVQ